MWGKDQGWSADSRNRWKALGRSDLLFLFLLLYYIIIYITYSYVIYNIYL